VKPSPENSVIVTVSPLTTVRVGPGDVTVVDVRPHPEGLENLPKRVEEEAAWARGI